MTWSDKEPRGPREEARGASVGAELGGARGASGGGRGARSPRQVVEGRREGRGRGRVCAPVDEARAVLASGHVLLEGPKIEAARGAEGRGLGLWPR